MSADIVSGGLFITRALPRPSGLGDGLLPDELLTLSSCLTEFVPDWWGLAWTSGTREERLSALAKLGLAEDLLDPIVRFATDAFERGELGWPCVWNSAASARGALELVAGSARGFMILEIGVALDVANELVNELAPRAGEAAHGFVARLNARRVLEPAAVPMGWEVLGVEDGGSFHSWLCNGIEKEAESQLGIRPGALGLLASKQEADAVVQLIRSGIGAEPVPWFSALVSRIE